MEPTQEPIILAVVPLVHLAEPMVDPPGTHLQSETGDGADPVVHHRADVGGLKQGQG